MIAKAQGQNTRSAFISGFMSSGFSVGTKGYGGVFGRTMIMAGVSGTVSLMTGGKFSNGAMTGAYVHLFNAEIKSLTGSWTKEDEMSAKAKEEAILKQHQIKMLMQLKVGNVKIVLLVLF
jgi:hypothetical protein